MFGKIHFVFTICFLIVTVSFSQNTFVPDDNFEQALIDLGLDAGPPDNFVPTANINTITNLDVSLLKIQDLTGIEDFTALEVLDCSENKLTDLNVSKNINLTQLFCSFNAITSLDVSHNVLLKILWCNFNKLPSLDVTSNTDLLSLICSNNLIPNIDVSKNQLLNTFICVGNGITDFDVSSNSQLKLFHCGNNNLSTIDVTKNPLLSDFNCEFNALDNMDVSQNKGLSVLNCGNNRLTSLNVSENKELTELYCANNAITFLTLSDNNKLTKIDCSNNDLCLVDLQNGTNEEVILFDARGNTSLYCVYVDDADYSSTNWTNIDPITNFVISQDDCNAVADITPKVDVLEDFYGIQFTLPVLQNGAYFTASDGKGEQLFSGDVITSSQTIYIYNTTSCYSNESRFSVYISSTENPRYFIPKYFTPNNDGEHDFWQVIDLRNVVNNISVYNRHGQLLKSFLPNSLGWDGTYNGKLMPNDSYWYEIVLNTREILRGHFALKR